MNTEHTTVYYAIRWIGMTTGSLGCPFGLLFRWCFLGRVEIVCYGEWGSPRTSAHQLVLTAMVSMLGTSLSLLNLWCNRSWVKSVL